MVGNRASRVSECCNEGPPPQQTSIACSSPSQAMPHGRQLETGRAARARSACRTGLAAPGQSCLGCPAAPASTLLMAHACSPWLPAWAGLASGHAAIRCAARCCAHLTPVHPAHAHALHGTGHRSADSVENRLRHVGEGGAAVQDGPPKGALRQGPLTRRAGGTPCLRQAHHAGGCLRGMPRCRRGGAHCCCKRQARPPACVSRCWCCRALPCMREGRPVRTLDVTSV